MLEGRITVEEIMSMELPAVTDLVKAQIRLAEAKSKAQKAAKDMAKLAKAK